MSQTTIEISKIVRDGGTQSRAQLNEDVITEYAEAMKEGTAFPDVWLVYDGQRYYITDGYHRIEAALRAGFTHIQATVVQGTLEDAQWQSYAVNKAHGLRRTNDDKRRAVIAALKHPRGAGKSDREIARHVGIHHDTVGRYRAELEASGEIRQIDQREVTRNGSTYTQNAARHWGLSNGMAFWSEVKRYKVLGENVLEQLQAGATHLTDLTLSKEDAFAKLKALAIDELLKRFPLESHVLHSASGRVARVTGCDGRNLAVFDERWASPDLWIAEGLTPASDAARELYMHPLEVGDTVQTRAGHITRITKIDGRFYYVEGDTRQHFFETLTKVDPLPVADDPLTEFQAEEDEQLANRVESDEQDETDPLNADAQAAVSEQAIQDSFNDETWLKRLSSTGILSVASRTADWYALDWIGRWRVIKAAFCPNPHEDAILFIQLGNDQYMTLDGDAELMSGTLYPTYGKYERHRQANAFMTEIGERAFLALRHMGASGVITYREMNFDVALLDAAPPTDEAADDTPRLPPLPWRTSATRGEIVDADGIPVAKIFGYKVLENELAAWLVSLVNEYALDRKVQS